MIKQLFLLLLIVFNLSINTFGCTCKYLGGFAYANQIADVIVKGKVLNYNCDETSDSKDFISMNFEVHKIYRGQVFKDTIIIYGDDGISCRPYINKFKIGEEWLLAIGKLGNKYEVSICGELALKVIKNSYSGKIYGHSIKSHKELIGEKELQTVINKPYKYTLKRDRCYQSYPTLKRLDYYNYRLTKCSIESLSIKISKELMKVAKIEKIKFKHLFYLNMAISKDRRLNFLCIARGSYNNSIDEDLGLSYWSQKVLLEKIDCSLEIQYPLKYPKFISIPILIGNY
ncbi:hypothetical protein [Flammeovirga agarivorans]|uniref:Tissue inhibitor of metalloproteinase n=1 Tax=Flammeovirga agarivorans TaxID=2726742 RepID=A0A7X8XZB8_9BACT|nr:hypothetical protein [Flammeovirga agarivorans]NLR95029.1 hypothetical protein [Flammeovirga agarivorans]